MGRDISKVCTIFMPREIWYNAFDMIWVFFQENARNTIIAKLIKKILNMR